MYMFELEIGGTY